MLDSRRALWIPQILAISAPIALVLAGAAGASGAPALSSHYVAGFSGSVLNNIATTNGSCSRSSIPGSPSFSLANGRGGLSLTSRAHSCTLIPVPAYNNTTGTYSSASGGIQISVPIYSLGGNTTVLVNLSVSLSGYIALVPGTCHRARGTSYWDCWSQSQIGFSLTAEVLDNTTQTLYGVRSGVGLDDESYNQSQCSIYGSCSYYSANSSGAFSMAQTYQFRFNPGTGMVRADHYYVVLVFSAGVNTYWYQGTAKLSGNSEIAKLDVDTKGDGIRLNSIVEI